MDGVETFDQISPDKFVRIQQNIKAELGIDMQGQEAGEAASRGFVIGWNYDHAAQSLVVQVVRKPFLVPESMVMGKIREFVASS